MNVPPVPPVDGKTYCQTKRNKIFDLLSLSVSISLSLYLSIPQPLSLFVPFTFSFPLSFFTHSIILTLILFFPSSLFLCLSDLLFKATDLEGIVVVSIPSAKRLREPVTWFNGTYVSLSLQLAFCPNRLLFLVSFFLSLSFLPLLRLFIISFFPLSLSLSLFLYLSLSLPLSISFSLSFNLSCFFALN